MSDQSGRRAALIHPVPTLPAQGETGGRPPGSASRADTGGRPAGPAATPVSVVMPARNEERYLAESVSRILAQDYDGELELVLSVGPSTDQTRQLASALAATDPRITVIDNPSGRIPAALNLALAASRHPVVVRVDARALLPQGYIRTAVTTLRQTGAANVGGIMAAEGVTAFQRAVAWAMTSPFGVGSASNHTGGASGPAPTAYMGVFRRSAIERAGGFNERFEIAEDWELNHRIRRTGGLIWFQPELAVTYRPRATVRELAAQYFRYGRWRRVVCRQHPGTVNLRYLAPPVAVAAVVGGLLSGLAGLAGRALGARGWPAHLAGGFVLPLGYAATTAAVAGRASRELPGPVAARLPVALATMHLCWGTGFLTSPRGLAGPAAVVASPLPSPSRLVDESARDGQVVGIGDLEIALAADHRTDGDLRQIAQDDAAVIGGRGGGKAGVGLGALVGVADDGEVEALRRLAAGERVTRQHSLNGPVGYLDDGVGRWHHDADGLPPVEGRDAVRDDALIDQRPGGIMEQHPGVGRGLAAKPSECLSGRVGPTGPAPDHRGHLGHGSEFSLDLFLQLGGGHDQHLVDTWGTLEGPYAVLDETTPSQYPHLLRAGRAEPAA